MYKPKQLARSESRKNSVIGIDVLLMRKRKKEYLKFL